MKRLLLSVFTLLLLTVGTVLAGPFEDGLAAHNRGDYTEAMKGFHVAAVQGDADAQFRLGNIYRTGLGIEQDYSEAVKWYRLAAAQGNAGAQFKLGMMYTLGSGVWQDYVRAYMWISLSAVSDKELAPVTRDAIKKEMTSPANCRSAEDGK